MYDAVCSNCGKDCQVPFRPTGEKPVLCRDCFRQSGGQQQTRRPDERSFQRPSFQNNAPQNNQYKAQLDALTIKVDKILEILTAATTPVNKTSEEIVGAASDEDSSGEPKTEVSEPTPKKKRKTTKKDL